MKTKRSKAKIQAERKSTAVPYSEPAQELQVLRPDAGGIDCGAQEHYVAVPPDRVKAGEATVRRFSAFTEGLDAAVEWFRSKWIVLPVPPKLARFVSTNRRCRLD